MDKKVLPPKRPEINFDHTRLISISAFEEYKKVENIKWKKIIISFGSLSLLFAFFIFSFLISEFMKEDSSKALVDSFDQQKKIRNAALRIDRGDALHLHDNGRSPASIQKYHYHDPVSNDHLQYDYQESTSTFYDHSAYDDSVAPEETQESVENFAVGEVFEPQPPQDEGQFMVEPDSAE
jgi:hypothetical protein